MGGGGGKGEEKRGRGGTLESPSELQGHSRLQPRGRVGAGMEGKEGEEKEGEVWGTSGNNKTIREEVRLKGETF